MAHWTPEAVRFVNDLKTVDTSLAIWAEVRIDGGATLTDTKKKLREAMRVVEQERA